MMTGLEICAALTVTRPRHTVPKSTTTTVPARYNVPWGSSWLPTLTSESRILPVARDSQFR